ncbi:GIY-YIG nuclease family protein [Enterovirga rhinocerotis]|uniref:Meiotically Up-regulated Gene 113 (MUG113) protein n=1 Tax=Enterovirga rhinocerotis TaxID=1339210 RepID=A0A4R7BYJ7_9HYPH|nr:GIY-YIG nuclease family protein [Enterovirga rhinocerotis]TDR90352.1 Meiotically Up-regulated Gene 113 (MUG113) protein [Enterovirga rhinocerotis]
MGARERIGAREVAEILGEALRRVQAPIGHRPNKPFRVERIRDKELASVVGIPLGELRRLSENGDVPTAAKLSDCYSYNVLAIRKWIRKGGPDRHRPKQPVRHGKVYVVASGEHIKIGFASDPGRRLASLQTASPFKLVTVAIFAGSTLDERALHRRFAGQQAVGEWFRREGELAAWIEEGCPL